MYTTQSLEVTKDLFDLAIIFPKVIFLYRISAVSSIVLVRYRFNNLCEKMYTIFTTNPLIYFLG